MAQVDLFGNPVLSDALNMRDFFFAPPFSIIDTTEASWVRRRNRWLKKTGNLSLTKEGTLGGTDSMLGSINEGSSNFDPVLAEVIYKWFNISGGRILDPFGGEQTKGVVAGELGFEYFACEFRQEQVDVNMAQCSGYNNVKYFCGDSNNIDTILPNIGYDFCFTSPPYYDLEVYSAADMSALGTYEEFMAQYKNIFQKCFNMLNNNRFLAVKIGEIKNKKTGEYRNFVGDNITIFKQIGFKYYNEIILKNATGTLPLRSGKTMNASRKIGKMHQNVLVFFKGELKDLNSNYHDIIPKNEFYAKD